MTNFRLWLSVLLMLMAGYVVLMNWARVAATIRNRRRGIPRRHSTVPLVSLLLAGLAAAVYPFTPRLWIGLIPLTDVANLMLLWLPVFLIKEAKKRRP
jgi:hypothetical protein